MYYDAIEPLTPIDVLEPLNEENQFRDAGVSYLRVISLTLAHVLEADEPLTAAWGAAYALGLISLTGNTSMRETARELGLSHGTLSYHAKLVGKKLNLPPSILMKDEQASEKSREARFKYIARGEDAAKQTEMN
jgi:hypothetical protein